jgi:hypothetical protein
VSSLRTSHKAEFVEEEDKLAQGVRNIFMTGNAESDDDEGGVSLYGGAEDAEDVDDDADENQSPRQSASRSRARSYADDGTDGDRSATHGTPKPRGRTHTAVAGPSTGEGHLSTRDGSGIPPAKPWDTITDPNRYRSS